MRAWYASKAALRSSILWCATVASKCASVASPSGSPRGRIHRLRRGRHPRPHRVEKMTELAVAVPISTLWSAPDAPREVDAPAISATPDISAWYEAMNTEDRLGL